MHEDRLGQKNHITIADNTTASEVQTRLVADGMYATRDPVSGVLLICCASCGRGPMTNQFRYHGLLFIWISLLTAVMTVTSFLSGALIASLEYVKRD